MQDARAVRTLFETYWSPAGWRPDSERHPSAEAFDHAKRCGVMFDPVRVDHDDLISRLLKARDALSPRVVADAFLASLTTRQLELRAALATYSVFRHLPAHRANFVGKACSVCGLHESDEQTEDLNVLNFERLKWGGVRHDQPLFATFALERFLAEGAPRPTLEDTDLLRLVLETVRGVPSSTTSAQVQRFFPKSFRSNKAERDVVVAILGFTGILAVPTHPSYRLRFVTPQERSLPDRRFVDMGYPACWWSAVDGLDSKAASDYFGHVL